MFEADDPGKRQPFHRYLTRQSSSQIETLYGLYVKKSPKMAAKNFYIESTGLKYDKGQNIFLNKEMTQMIPIAKNLHISI